MIEVRKTGYPLLLLSHILLFSFFWDLDSNSCKRFISVSRNSTVSSLLSWGGEAVSGSVVPILNPHSSVTAFRLGLERCPSPSPYYPLRVCSTQSWSPNSSNLPSQCLTVWGLGVPIRSGKKWSKDVLDSFEDVFVKELTLK